MDLILFGIQGSGKGTQGKMLAERYGLKIFETGGALRSLAQEDSELARKVKSIIEAGHLVPNGVVMEIVEDFINKQQDHSPILFDGIPRSIEQAKSLNALLDKHARKYTAVLIDLSEESALKRLTTRRICKNDKTAYPATYQKDSCEKCGGELITRSDDNPEAIQTRLQAFSTETLPAIELYSQNLIKLDGEPPIEQVSKELYAAFDPVMMA